MANDRENQFFQETENYVRGLIPEARPDFENTEGLITHLDVLYDGKIRELLRNAGEDPDRGRWFAAIPPRKAEFFDNLRNELNV